MKQSVSQLDRQLTEAGTIIMDRAKAEMDLDKSGEMSRIGSMMTRINTLMGPSLKEVSTKDRKLIEQFVLEINPK